MNIFIKILKWLSEKYLGKPESVEIQMPFLRFVKQPDPKQLLYVLESDELAFFIDKCKRTHLLRLESAEKEKREEVIMSYLGVCFVENEIVRIAAELKPKKKQENLGSFDLSDDGLLRENKNG